MSIVFFKLSHIKALKHLKNIFANLKISNENFKFHIKKANLWG